MAWDDSDDTGCCTCHGQACQDTTLYECDDEHHRHADCVFVIGGHCAADGCVKPATATRTPTKTQRSTATPTRTKTRTKTKTPSLTPTIAATATQTGEPAGSPTATGNATASGTATLSATPTASDTETPIAVDTATATETATATGTATGTASATVTATRESTNTPDTASGATATQTPAPTVTATASEISTVTQTATPSATPTATPICQMTPRSGCRQPMSPRSWVLFLRDVADRSDRFVWKWRGVSTGIEDFANPLSTTTYAFCLYAGPSQTRVLQALAPAGGTCGPRPCWRKRDGRRFKYLDPDRTPDGLSRIALRTRPSTTRANIVVAGKGENLAMPALPLEQPLLAQLVQSDGLNCWEATFTAPALKNSTRQFRDKNDP